MARQNRTTKQAEGTPEATTEETPVTEQVTENQSNEAPEASSTETKPEEKPVDLTGFQAAVTAALAEADTTTGEVPEAEITKVNEQYRALEGMKGKNAARKWVEEQLLERVSKLDAVAARGFNDINNNLSAAGGSSTPKAPADPVAAYVNREAILQVALQIVFASRPETDRDLNAEVAEVMEKSSEDVSKMKEWLANEAEDKGDAPEVSALVRAAFKAAQAKGVGGTRAPSSGPRGDIAKHILSAFADKEVGTFMTVSEIGKHKSAEYSENPPSQGAVSARLFPNGDGSKCTIEGIEAVDAKAVDGKNPKGARKVA